MSPRCGYILFSPIGQVVSFRWHSAHLHIQYYPHTVNVIARHFSKRSFPSFAVCQSERHPESYGDIEDEDVRLSAALNGTDDAEAQASHNGDAPGMEGCNDGGSSPSNKDGEAVPRARVSSRF